VHKEKGVPLLYCSDCYGGSTAQRDTTSPPIAEIIALHHMT
jgi:hypothetical protein